MAYYGYEYFCGANVVIEVEGFPLLQAVGISTQVQESKRPIYGYSSRFFDAVARGQVIVQGSLLVNYVHQDYLFRAIEDGQLRKAGGAIRGPVASSKKIQDLTDAGGNSLKADQLAATIINDYGQNHDLSETLKAQFWAGTAQLTSIDPIGQVPNPHDIFGGLSILVTFGERSDETGYLGDTGYFLSDVYFTGRGQQIQIDENVILEEYTFFARNMFTIKQTQQISNQVENGNATVVVEPTDDVAFSTRSQEGTPFTTVSPNPLIAEPQMPRMLFQR